MTQNRWKLTANQNIKQRKIAIKKLLSNKSHQKEIDVIAQQKEIDVIAQQVQSQGNNISE